MASLLLVALCLALSLPLAFAVPPAGTTVCPVFKCGPGNFLHGKFVGTKSGPDYALEYSEPTEPLIEAYFTAGQMYNYAQYGITDEAIQNPQLDCYKLCEGINKKLPSNEPKTKKAKYWMFEETCLDASGGICTCYNMGQCKNETDSYPDRYTVNWNQNSTGLQTADYQVAANFTVGELCEGKDKGDPHFTGADGSHYDFSGRPNRNYALISDSHFQMNGFFGGRYSRWNADVKALTWIRSVSFMVGHHTLVLEARRGASAEYLIGYMARIVADGVPVEITVPGTTAQLWEGASVRWESARMLSGNDLVDVYDVVVGQTTVRLTLRPEVKNLRTATDGAVHFGLDILQSAFSNSVHGVLGQTFRPDFQGRLGNQQLVWSDLLQVMMVPGDNAEGFVDGSIDDYQVSDLLKANCKFCHFARSETVDEEMSNAMNMIASAVGGGLPATPRKFLQSY